MVEPPPPPASSNVAVHNPREAQTEGLAWRAEARSVDGRDDNMTAKPKGESASRRPA